MTKQTKLILAVAAVGVLGLLYFQKVSATKAPTNMAVPPVPTTTPTPTTTQEDNLKAAALAKATCEQRWLFGLGHFMC